jgi:hypothetical protein
MMYGPQNKKRTPHLGLSGAVDLAVNSANPRSPRLLLGNPRGIGFCPRDRTENAFENIIELI